jgi:dephospho-CoA kinase
MIVVGITGSIATGKTNLVHHLRDLGLHVQDADVAVHQMFETDPTVIEKIRSLWPDCVSDKVDRACLREKVLEDTATIEKLEAITHPLVRNIDLQFIEERRQAGDDVVFLDVPLLYEAGFDEFVDCAIVVYCAPAEQRRRALARGTDPTLLDYLMARQLPMTDKITRADYAISSDGTLDQTREKLIQVLHQIEQKYGVRIVRDNHA